MLKLVSNKIRCKFCGDVIESFSRHDFKTCRCKKSGVDGGTDYARRIFFTEKPEDCFEELSTFIDENGKIVSAAEAKQEDIPMEPVRVEIKKVEEDTIQGQKVPDALPVDDAPDIPENFIPEVKHKEPEASVAEERKQYREDKLKQKSEAVAKIKEMKAEGKSFSDISKELGLPEATIRMYYKQN